MSQDSMDEAELIRIRLDEADDEATRQEPQTEPGGPILVARTKTVGMYPTAAASFFACESLDVFGDEVEGAAGTVTGEADTFMAFNIGASIPATGTKILCFGVPHRMVFQYD